MNQPERPAIDGLARLMFTGNPCDAPIIITLPGVANSMGLFLFCVDLLMRGLLLVHAAQPPGQRGTTPVAVHDLTDSDFSAVAAKMACGGILVRKNTLPAPHEASNINSEELLAMPPQLPLPSYVLRVDNRGVRHEISFAISHVPSNGMPCFRQA